MKLIPDVPEPMLTTAVVRPESPFSVSRSVPVPVLTWKML